MTAETENYPIIDKWTLRTHVVEYELSDEEEAMLTFRAAEYGLIQGRSRG